MATARIGQETKIIKNVTLNWVKIAEPVDNYNGDKKIYEIQASVPEERKGELEQLGKVRPMGDLFGLNLHKNAFKVDGTEAKKVRCVDGNKLELDPRIVGNGSVGNIMVMTSPYEIKHPKSGKVTKSGTSTMLLAIQVTKLVKYEPKSGIDFDEEEMSGNDMGEGDAPADDDRF